jgi:NAD(P)-dependent dehydrogenase (short-subunit alcohol dehydrogenase family)
MTELTQKVALVTGAGRGIGQATALELTRQGLKVALVARSKAEIEATAAQIHEQGGTTLPISFDLANLADIEGLVSRVEAELGPIDILVNNAAIGGPYGATWELDPAEWARAIEINLIAPFWLTRAVLPNMRERNWGRIINVSSGPQTFVIPRTGAYTTTKAGLDVFSRQLGVELADSGIVVIGLYPGPVDTGIQAELRRQPPEKIGQELSDNFRRIYANGMLSSPTPVGMVIATLAGDAGENFRGQVISINSPEVQALLKGESIQSGHN